VDFTSVVCAPTADFFRHASITAALCCQLRLTHRHRKFADSALEQSGFEPLVPPPSRTLRRAVHADINDTAYNERVRAED
jgi:hypothetical protein